MTLTELCRRFVQSRSLDQVTAIALAAGVGILASTGNPSDFAGDARWYYACTAGILLAAALTLIGARFTKDDTAKHRFWRGLALASVGAMMQVVALT